MKSFALATAVSALTTEPYNTEMKLMHLRPIEDITLLGNSISNFLEWSALHQKSYATKEEF